MRSAELADLTRDAARTAIASRDLVGARDTASVLGTRIRGRVYPMISQDHRSAAASRSSGASQGSTCMTNRKVCSRRRCTDRLNPPILFFPERTVVLAPGNQLPALFGRFPQLDTSDPGGGTIYPDRRGGARACCKRMPIRSGKGSPAGETRTRRRLEPSRAGTVNAVSCRRSPGRCVRGDNHATAIAIAAARTARPTSWAPMSRGPSAARPPWCPQVPPRQARPPDPVSVQLDRPHSGCLDAGARTGSHAGPWPLFHLGESGRAGDDGSPAGMRACV